jgi:hypothetical protein
MIFVKNSAMKEEREQREERSLEDTYWMDCTQRPGFPYCPIQKLEGRCWAHLSGNKACWPPNFPQAHLGPSWFPWWTWQRKPNSAQSRLVLCIAGYNFESTSPLCCLDSRGPRSGQLWVPAKPNASHQCQNVSSLKCTTKCQISTSFGLLYA